MEGRLRPSFELHGRRVADALRNAFPRWTKRRRGATHPPSRLLARKVAREEDGGTSPPDAGSPKIHQPFYRIKDIEKGGGVWRNCRQIRGKLPLPCLRRRVSFALFCFRFHCALCRNLEESLFSAPSNHPRPRFVRFSFFLGIHACRPLCGVTFLYVYSQSLLFDCWFSFFFLFSFSFFFY